MTRYAVPLHDLDVVWRTPAGAALVDSALGAQKADDAEVVEVGGAEAVVLRGPVPFVAALVEGFVAAAFPAPGARTVRVFANDGDGWRRVGATPGDEVAGGRDRTRAGSSEKPGLAPGRFACR